MIVLQLEYLIDLIAVITFVFLLGSGGMREENMQALCAGVLKKVAFKKAAVILLLKTWFAEVLAVSLHGN